MQFGAVVLRVVANGQHAAAGDRAGLSKKFEEFPEALPIESSGLAAKYERAISQSNCGEVSNAFARRVMVHHRVFDLWRHPHTTPRALLLEMHFVQSPKVDSIVVH